MSYLNNNNVSFHKKLLSSTSVTTGAFNPAIL